MLTLLTFYMQSNEKKSPRARRECPWKDKKISSRVNAIMGLWEEPSMERKIFNTLFDLGNKRHSTSPAQHKNQVQNPSNSICRGNLSDGINTTMDGAVKVQSGFT